MTYEKKFGDVSKDDCHGRQTSREHQRSESRMDKRGHESMHRKHSVSEHHEFDELVQMQMKNVTKMWVRVAGEDRSHGEMERKTNEGGPTKIHKKVIQSSCAQDGQNSTDLRIPVRNMLLRAFLRPFLPKRCNNIPQRT